MTMQVVVMLNGKEIKLDKRIGRERKKERLVTLLEISRPTPVSA
jgi:hypothetical protein